MKNSFFSIMAIMIFCLLKASPTKAQTKVDINNGPVTAFSKNNCKPSKRLGKNRLYLSEKVWLKKGDWLIAKTGTRSGKPISIDVYDRDSKRYVKTSEDTTRLKDLNTYRYHSEVEFQANRSDTFDVLFSINYKKELEEQDQIEEYSWGAIRAEVDTVLIDYTIAALNSQWRPKDTSWGFQQRLSYICNNWTAGFSAIPKNYNKEEFEKFKKIVAYYPVAPVALDNRMNVSLQVLGHNGKLVYFMYTNDEPYSQAKKLYDELYTKLKAATDKASISDLSQMRRVNEMATAYFSLKVPEIKKPIEFYLFGEAGKGFEYLPINLFLYGTKEKAKVLVVLGEPDSDIYDIGS